MRNKLDNKVILVIAITLLVIVLFFIFFNNPKKQITTELILKCNSQVVLPKDTKETNQLFLGNNLILAWVLINPEEPLGSLDSLSEYQYGVFECQDGEWIQKYISSKETGFIDFSLLPHKSILVVKTIFGSGTATFWDILYKNNNEWKVNSGKVINQDDLDKINLGEFMGYNVVEVIDENIIEILPGYMPGDSRCCPSGEIKKVIYYWDGSKLNFLSVENIKKVDQNNNNKDTDNNQNINDSINDNIKISLDCPVGKTFFDQNCLCPAPWNVQIGNLENGFNCVGMPKDHL